MSISNVHFCGQAAPRTTVSTADSAAANPPRPRASDDDDESACHGQPRGGGPLRDALADALHSLGISVPQQAVEGRRHDRHHERRHGDEHEHEHEHEHRHRAEHARPGGTPVVPAPAGPAVTASEPADDAAEAAPVPVTPAAPVTARTLRSDLHDFMHELFQAVRGAYEASTTPLGDVQPTDATTTLVPTSVPGSRLAIGLSALVAQVGAGQAPAGLQGAFDQLMNDLQAYGGPTPPANPDGSPAASPTLQQVLGALQQRLGYGSSANDVSALGNTVDLAA